MPNQKFKTGDKTINKLYEAVVAYIEKRGGKVMVIGGVAKMKEPTDLKFNYSLVIRITGKEPEFKN